MISNKVTIEYTDNVAREGGNIILYTPKAELILKLNSNIPLTITSCSLVCSDPIIMSKVLPLKYLETNFEPNGETVKVRITTPSCSNKINSEDGLGFFQIVVAYRQDGTNGTVKSDNINVKTKLLKKKSPVDVKDANGMTALMRMCRYGEFECVSALLGRGARQLATDSGGLSALMHACSGRHIKIVKLLLTYKKGKAGVLHHKDNDQRTVVQRVRDDLDNFNPQSNDYSSLHTILESLERESSNTNTKLSKKKTAPPNQINTNTNIASRSARSTSKRLKASTGNHGFTRDDNSRQSENNLLPLSQAAELVIDLSHIVGEHTTSAAQMASQHNETDMNASHSSASLPNAAVCYICDTIIANLDDNFDASDMNIFTSPTTNCLSGDIATVKALDDRNRKSCLKRDVEIVKYLLSDKNTNIHEKDNDGFTAAGYMQQWMNNVQVYQILDSNNESSSEGSTDNDGNDSIVSSSSSSSNSSLNNVPIQAEDNKNETRKRDRDDDTVSAQKRVELSTYQCSSNNGNNSNNSE